MIALELVHWWTIPASAARDRIRGARVELHSSMVARVAETDTDTDRRAK
jgi:hypothetical protein